MVSARIIGFTLVFLVVFGFISIFSYYFMDQYIQVYNTTGYYTGSAVTAGEGFLKGLRMFDNIIVVLATVLILGVAVTSYRVASAPVFFIVMFITAAFYGMISLFFNYLFQMLVSPPVFTTTLAYFQRTVLIMSNLHWVTLAQIIIGSIALYGKKEKGQFLA